MKCVNGTVLSFSSVQNVFLNMKTNSIRQLKVSITAHLHKFVHDLDLYNVKKRNILLMGNNTFAKFDKNKPHRLISITYTNLYHLAIVTLTFDLWPSQISEFKNENQCCSSSHHGQNFVKSHENTLNSSIFIIFTMLFLFLSILTLTSDFQKINRLYLLVIVNMSAKFEEDTQNKLVSIKFTRSKFDGCTHRHLHWLTVPQNRYYIPFATHLHGKINNIGHTITLIKV